MSTVVRYFEQRARSVVGTCPPRPRLITRGVAPGERTATGRRPPAMLPPSRGRRVRVVLAGAAAVLIIVTGVALSTSAQARQEPALADTSVFGAGAKPIERVPANDASRGLSYDGLRAAKTGPCVGGYEI